MVRFWTIFLSFMLMSMAMPVLAQLPPGCSFSNVNQPIDEEESEAELEAQYVATIDISLSPSDPNYDECMRIAVQQIIASGDCLYKSTILYDNNNQAYAVERTLIRGWSNRVVQCIENKIDEVTHFTNGMFGTAILGIAGVALVIYFILFCIRVMLNPGGNLFTDGVVMLITLCFVAVFSLGSGSDKAYDVFKTLQVDLITAVTDSMQIRTIRGELIVDTDGNPILDADGNEQYKEMRCITGPNGGRNNLWQRIDCITMHVFSTHTGVTYAQAEQNGKVVLGDLAKSTEGDDSPFTFKTGYLNNGLDNVKVTNVLLLIMSGSMFSSTGLGWLMVMTGGFVLVGLIAAIFQCIVVYLAARIYIAFMAVITPALIVCLLFQSTKKIFTYSLSIIASAILQPAILFGYMAFMMNVYHFVLEGDEGLLESMKLFEKKLDGGEFDDLFGMIGSLDIGTVDTSENAVAYDGAGNVTLKDGGGAFSMAQGVFSKGFFAYILEAFGDNEEANDAAFRQLIQGLMVMLAVLLITFAFMENVLSFGAQIAGVGLSASYAVMNVHSMAMSRMSNAAKKTSVNGVG